MEALYAGNGKVVGANPEETKTQTKKAKKNETTVSKGPKEAKEGGLSGRLALTVVEAKLLRDCETFGSMDPFVEIKLRDMTVKTETHKSGGKTPKWNQEFSFDVQDGSEEMKFTVFDYEKMKSHDVVCEGTIKMSQLCLGLDN